MRTIQKHFLALSRLHVDALYIAYQYNLIDVP